MTGVETMVFDGMGHLQMCLDRSVREWVYEQLRGLNPGAKGATT